jgi:hypothetical protein
VSISDCTRLRITIFWASDTEERPGLTDHVKSAAERYHSKKGNGAQQGQARKWEREWEQQMEAHDRIRNSAP